MSNAHPELPAPPPLPAGGLRVVPLGGLGEVGRNMSVLEFDGRLLVIDCGVLFPEDHQPGVDLILPDFEYIADRLRTMWARGCDIKVLYGLMGFPVKRHIGANTSRGRIPLHSLGYDYNGDGDVDRYTHQKYLTIKGYWGGNPNASVVFTGSSNWTNKGTGGDEIVFNMHGPGNVAKYNTNWDFMWNNHSRNAYTTTASEYSTVVPVWRGDVLTHEVMTRRVVTTTVEPDHLKAGSPTFESD